MTAQPPARAVLLGGITQMTLNERFTTLLRNTGPKPVNHRPCGWQRPPAARYLRRRGAGAAIGGGRDLLLLHGDWPLPGARGTRAPRTTLKGSRWIASPRGLRSPAQRLDRKGPQGRAHIGGRGRGQGRFRGRGQGRGRFRGRGRGQGISPLNRQQFTKEQLDQELDAYMAMAKAQERPDTDLDADDMAQPVPDQEGPDTDLDADDMAQPVPDQEGLDDDLDADDMAQPVPDQDGLDDDLDADDMAQPVPDQEGLDDDLDAIMADPGPESPTQNDS